MGAHVLVTQGARASATMIFTMMNWIGTNVVQQAIILNNADINKAQ